MPKNQPSIEVQQAAQILMEAQAPDETILVAQISDLNPEASAVSCVMRGSVQSILVLVSAVMNLLKEDPRFLDAYLDLVDSQEVPEGTKILAQSILDKLSDK